jgi:PAS domain-containing protein/anti-sigma regulatory factor (Ser/Thr protein kinase)
VGYILRKIFFIILLIVCLPFPRIAAAHILLDDTLDFRKISRDAEYIEDTGKALSFDEIRRNGSLKWIKSENDYINFGYSRSQYWFRFTVDNRTKMTLSWLFEIDYPSIDSIELYLPGDSGNYTVRKTGDFLPFTSRDMIYINYIFRMNQKPGPMTFYICMSSVDSINLNLNMLSHNYFLKRLYKDLPLYWLYFGLMIIMALYHMVFFVTTRDRGYLYLSGFIFTYALFELNLKGFAYQYLWPDTPWLTNHVTPFLFSQMILWTNLFLSEFVDFKNIMQRFERLHLFLSIAVSSALGVLSLFFFDRITFFLIFAYAVPNVIIIWLVGIYFSFIKKPPNRQARIALLAFTPFALAVPLLSLVYLGILPITFFTRGVLQIGTTLTVMLLSFGMADKINIMKRTIQAGEKRYKHLVESTTEIIFTLDDNNTILGINSAVEKHLGYRPDDLAGTNFLDLIVETWNTKINIVHQLVLENISELNKKKSGNVQFRTTMKNKYIHEPKDLSVTLEYNSDMDAGYAILGKASPIADDALSMFLESEQFTYNLNNYLSNADLMSQRLVRNLYRFADTSTILNIRIALREAIINAIEHGNLRISFDEKTELQSDGKYFDTIKSRQMDPSSREKKVRVEYSLNEEHVSYSIYDDGSGFDPDAVTNADRYDINMLTLPHGRGLEMIRNTFDEVRFNEKGNGIILVMYFKNSNGAKKD